MFNKTQDRTTNEQEPLAASRSHLDKLRENAAELRTVQSSISDAQASVIQLRQQRGASPDPVLNREIAKRSTELEILADRRSYLQNESVHLRRSAGSFVGALDAALNTAITDAQAEFRVRFVAAVQALVPLVAEGIALGVAGAVRAGEACRGVIIPDPSIGNFFAVLGTPALIHDGIIAAELSPASVSESAMARQIRSQRAAASDLRAVISQVEVEDRVWTEAEDARKRAARPQFSGAQLGGMPAPEEKRSGLFPRTEYSGDGFANMHPGSVDTETSTSKAFSTSGA